MAAIAADVQQSAERRQEVLAVDLEKEYAARHAGSLVFRPGDVGADYVQFALNPQSRVPLGYEWPDAVLRGGIAPGEVATLAAGSGNGKTTVMANIAYNNAHVPILMASIEMPLILIAARLFAMSQGEVYRTLEERLKAGSDNLEARIGRELEQAVPNLGLMGVGAPSIELLEKAVITYREQWSLDPRLVMIDYLDLMSPNSENVEAVKRKYVDLRAFAKAHELGILVAHQLKREVLEYRNGQPLQLTDMRYAGETESDHLLAVYRQVNDRAIMMSPQALAEARRTIHIQALKTRSGEPAGLLVGHELGWNPDTLRITDTPDGWTPPAGPTGAMQVLMQQEELRFDGA
jgi:replicative DNA helicase